MAIKKKNTASNSGDKRRQNNGQGFASMSRDKVEKIASKGGQAAQASGRAHKLTDSDRERGGEERAKNADYHKLGKMGAQARWSDDSDE
jgi:general stress protein YciG